MSLAGGSLSILHQGNTLFSPVVGTKERLHAFVDVTEKFIMIMIFVIPDGKESLFGRV